MLSDILLKRCKQAAPAFQEDDGDGKVPVSALTRRDGQDGETQLECFKSRACCFPHPGDPSSYSALICPSQIKLSVRQSPGHNAHDIGVTSGRREHELSTAPHVERRARPLERLWQTQALDGIIVTAERQRLVTEESCYHLHSLFQAGNAFLRAGKRNTRLRILRREIARADAQLKTPAREHIQSRRLACQGNRMPEIVAKDIAANAQRRRG